VVEVDVGAVSDPHSHGDTKRGHRGGDDQPHVEVAHPADLTAGAQLVDHCGFPAVLALGGSGAQCRRRRHDLVAEDDRLLVLQIVLGEGVHRPAQRLERGHVRRLALECLDEAGERPVALGEQHVFLRREVPEDRARGDFAVGGDLLDRDLVEAPGGKETERGPHELLACALLLALAQARLDHDPEAWQDFDPDAM